VNGAVGEMDKVTQQNAASAEESSSAASELNGQAEELAAMVGAFQLARSQVGASTARPAVHAGATHLAPRRAAAAAKGGAAKPVLPPPPGRQSDPFPMEQADDVRDF
jgi:methyl-accepting chemotaxis protein